MIEFLKSHASVRKYTDDPVPASDVREIVAAGQHAASSHLVQAYTVIHLTDPSAIQQFATLSNNPFQVLGAGAVLLFCMDYHRLERATAKHDTPIDYGFAENTLVGAIDVAICAQNVVIAAESKGYGICYIGGVRNAPEEISALCKLPHGVFPLFGMTIGVPTKSHEVKPRLPLAAVLHENTYDASIYDTLLQEYDETTQQYYATRSSNQKDTSWSRQMADFLRSPQRTFMQEALQKQGFSKK